MRGAWARSILAAVAGDTHPVAQVDSVEVEPGRVTVQVGECTVTLESARVPPRVWTAMTRYARGMGQLESAAAGRAQSAHFDQLMAEDWDEPLVPRPPQIVRWCTCDEEGTCEHVAAAGVAFADEIDRDPAVLLRWRGCGTAVESPAGPPRDPWLGGRLPELPAARPRPAGTVLKRLGPSGIHVGDGDLVDALEPAYAAFARDR
ncbi:MAG: hypothetical protein ACRDM1_16630 [Gaiellaceae bacterium]